MKIFFIISISLVFIIGIIFIINPFFLQAQVLSNLSDLRNYFSIFSSVVGFIITITGLLLGFFYYWDRHKKDGIKNNAEKRDRVINYILNELIEYDKSVDQIYYCEIKSDKELAKARSKINRSYENIQLYLEEHDNLLQLKEESIQNIISVHSYVEQSDLIMLSKLKDLKEANLSESRDLYIEKILKAKRVCINKLHTS